MPDAPTLLRRAVESHRNGQLAAAAALYREVLKTDPRQPDALHLLGLIAQHEGRPTEAVNLFTDAIAANPLVAQYRLNRGLTLRAIGRTADALEDFQQAVALDPSSADAHLHHGNALKQLGHFRDAVAPLRTSVTLAPASAVNWLNLGTALLELRELDEARTAFSRALQLEPTRADAHNILGYTLALSGDFAAAEKAYTEALRLNPRYAPAHDNLGGLYKSQARIPEALQHYRAALEHDRSPATHSNLLLALNFSDTTSPAEIYAAHLRWAAGHASLSSDAPPARVSIAGERRLRVGYVSPDLVNHAVARFIEPVLECHDRARFEVFCYSQAARGDAVSERLQTLAVHWRNTALLTDEQMAEQIQRDQIDVLVDLAGHTAGNRLPVFTRRPAPVQITWLGYPNTTGIRAIDYRITDSISDPPGQTEAWHSEQLLRLPECFSCYRAPVESPPVSALPALTRGYITFGSFNQYPKIGPAVIELWAKLLLACPTARLSVRARSLADEQTASQVRAAFARLGVDPARIACDGRQLSTIDHLSVYHQVDVALDPFPYNGTTTTCESLWMGVPVVTLAGATHVSRVGASLLTHLGEPQWIASSPAEYINCASALAADFSRLSAIRASLRERFRASPLGDAARFTRHLEAAYATVWDRHCAAPSAK